ncbi:MAG: hypothetical protein U0271_33995 [Polyangiaceae bacterium]
MKRATTYTAVTTIVLVWGSLANADNAEPAPPPGFRRGTPLADAAFVHHDDKRPPEICHKDDFTCFAQWQVDLQPLPTLGATFDVPFQDMPLAAAEPIEPGTSEPPGAPKLQIWDYRGPRNGLRRAIYGGALRTLPEGLVGQYDIGERHLTFSRWNHLDDGIRLYPDRRPVDYGPFSFDTFGDYNFVSNPTFDRVEGNVDEAYEPHVERWLHGTAAPISWGLFHAARVPTNDGEVLVLTDGERVFTLGATESATTYSPGQEFHGVLGLHHVVGANSSAHSIRVVVDATAVSGEADRKLHIRVLVKRDAI